MKLCTNFVFDLHVLDSSDEGGAPLLATPTLCQPGHWCRNLCTNFVLELHIVTSRVFSIVTNEVGLRKQTFIISKVTRLD